MSRRFSLENLCRYAFTVQWSCPHMVDSSVRENNQIKYPQGSIMQHILRTPCWCLLFLVELKGRSSRYLFRCDFIVIKHSNLPIIWQKNIPQSLVTNLQPFIVIFLPLFHGTPSESMPRKWTIFHANFINTTKEICTAISIIIYTPISFLPWYLFLVIRTHAPTRPRRETQRIQETMVSS